MDSHKTMEKTTQLVFNRMTYISSVDENVWVNYRRYKCFRRCMKKALDPMISLNSLLTQYSGIETDFTLKQELQKKSLAMYRKLQNGCRKLPKYIGLVTGALRNTIKNCTQKEFTCAFYNVTQIFKFDKDGFVIPHERLMTPFARCGQKQFYVSTSQFLAVKAWEVCCKSGLISGAAVTSDEVECLRSSFSKMQFMNNLMLGTSYGDVSLTHKFVACPTDQVMPEELWVEGEPDNKNGMEACCGLRLCKNCTDFGYSDINCLAKTFILCQHSNQLNSTEAISLAKIENFFKSKKIANPNANTTKKSIFPADFKEV